MNNPNERSTHEMPKTNREEAPPPEELAEPNQNNPNSGERDRSGKQQPGSFVARGDVSW
jgi:hypothetical protein